MTDHEIETDFEVEERTIQRTLFADVEDSARTVQREERVRVALERVCQTVERLRDAYDRTPQSVPREREMAARAL